MSEGRLKVHFELLWDAYTSRCFVLFFFWKAVLVQHVTYWTKSLAVTTCNTVGIICFFFFSLSVTASFLDPYVFPLFLGGAVSRHSGIFFSCIWASSEDGVSLWLQRIMLPFISSVLDHLGIFVIIAYIAQCAILFMLIFFSSSLNHSLGFDCTRLLWNYLLIHLCFAVWVKFCVLKNHTVVWCDANFLLKSYVSSCKASGMDYALSCTSH